MSMANRMGIAVLALVGLLIAVYMLLYHVGAVGTVVCGEGGGCATVQNSAYASFLGLPVAAWGVGGYLTLLAVALAGVRAGGSGARWVAPALLGLTGAAFLFSVYLSVLEAFVIGAWCRWCVGSAVVATAAFVLAWPELKRVSVD